jgi:hypothetical protein
MQEESLYRAARTYFQTLRSNYECEHSSERLEKRLKKNARDRFTIREKRRVLRVNETNVKLLM